MKCLFEDFRHQVRTIHPPCPFDEGAVYFPLGGVGVEVDLLVGMFAVVMGRDVSRDNNHRDAIQRGVGNTCGAIRETGEKGG